MIIEILFPALGGFGMLLFGIHGMSHGLVGLAGHRMRIILKTLTRNRFFAVFTGMIATMFVQSSTLITVTTVGLLNASLLKLEQAIGIILGANIGTTFTAQLISFQIYEYALPAIALGSIFLFFAKREQYKALGNIFFGFGIMFFGFATLKKALLPVGDIPELADFFVLFGTYPFLGVIAGALVAALFQSSQAAVALTITLAVSGIIPLASAVAIAFGTDVGTTVTANIAAIPGSVNARRAARVHFLFNFIGVLYFLLLFPYFLKFVAYVTPSGDIGRQIANAQTLFNLINVVLFLPFISSLAKFSAYLVPERKGDVNGLDFLEEEALSHSSTAFDRLDLALSYMVDTVLQSFQLLRNFLHDRRFEFSRIRFFEERVDTYQDRILDYLGKIGQSGLRAEETKRIPKIINLVNSFEKIGDFTYRIGKIFRSLNEKTSGFTSEEIHLLKPLFFDVFKLLTLVKRLVSTKDLQFAQSLVDDFLPLHRLIRSTHASYQKKYASQDLLRINFFIHTLGLLDDLAFKCRNVAFIFLNRRGVETDEY